MAAQRPTSVQTLFSTSRSSAATRLCGSWAASSRSMCGRRCHHAVARVPALARLGIEPHDGAHRRCRRASRSARGGRRLLRASPRTSSTVLRPSRSERSSSRRSTRPKSERALRSSGSCGTTWPCSSEISRRRVDVAEQAHAAKEPARRRQQREQKIGRGRGRVRQIDERDEIGLARPRPPQQQLDRHAAARHRAADRAAHVDAAALGAPQRRRDQRARKRRPSSATSSRELVDVARVHRRERLRDAARAARASCSRRALGALLLARASSARCSSRRALRRPRAAAARPAVAPRRPSRAPPLVRRRLFRGALRSATARSSGRRRRRTSAARRDPSPASPPAPRAAPRARPRPRQPRAAASSVSLPSSSQARVAQSVDEAEEARAHVTSASSARLATSDADSSPRPCAGPPRA